MLFVKLVSIMSLFDYGGRFYHVTHLQLAVIVTGWCDVLVYNRRAIEAENAQLFVVSLGKTAFEKKLLL